MFLQQTYPDKYRGEELQGAPGTFRFTGREMDARAFEASHSVYKAVWEMRWVKNSGCSVAMGGVGVGASHISVLMSVPKQRTRTKYV